MLKAYKDLGVSVRKIEYNSIKKKAKFWLPFLKWACAHAEYESVSESRICPPTKNWKTFFFMGS